MPDGWQPRQNRTTPRHSHIIRPNHATSVPKRRVYVDTEAVRTRLDEQTERQTLAFGWALYEHTYRDRPEVTSPPDWCRFTQAADFWRWLERHTSKAEILYVYAHNWDYDAAMISLSTQAAERGWAITEFIPHPHILWIRATRDGRSIIFLDTLNYFVTSLAALGESIGFPKLPMPPGAPAGVEWEHYCRNDVLVLQKAMNLLFDFITQNDLGGYSKTAASQAFHAWRHRFMKHEVLVLADDELSQFEREAYHGARTDVWYDLRVTERVTALDVNSMYPYVMQTKLYPSRKLLKRKHATLVDLRRYLDGNCVIARVTVETDEPAYPYRTAERVIYPTGRFETVLSTPELVHALKRGRITDCSQLVVYEAQPLFRDYVTELYRLRQEYRAAGNEAFAYLCKLMLNSLYGKFGQRGKRWEECGEEAPGDIPEWHGNCNGQLEVRFHRVRMGKVWHQSLEGEAFESIPAIAAHVTAEGRMYLWSLIEAAGRRHVYYNDTDSLYVDDVGRAALARHIDSLRLGALKVEGEYEWAHFRAPKDYQLPTGEHVKGVRRNARLREPGVYQQEQFESYDSVLSRGADGEVIVKTLTKQVSRRNLQSVGEGIGWRSPITLP